MVSNALYSKKAGAPAFLRFWTETGSGIGVGECVRTLLEKDLGAMLRWTKMCLCLIVDPELINPE